MSNDIDILKKRNAKDSYDDFRVRELKNCIADPLYFIENYVKIQHPKLGRVPFEPYEFQRRIISSFHKHDNVVALTARQMGKCVHPETLVTKDGKKVEISSLVKKSFREKIIEWLEKKLISLSR